MTTDTTPDELTHLRERNAQLLNDVRLLLSTLTRMEQVQHGAIASISALSDTTFIARNGLTPETRRALSTPPGG